MIRKGNFIAKTRELKVKEIKEKSGERERNKNKYINGDGSLLVSKLEEMR